MTAPDLRPCFTAQTAAHVHPGLTMKLAATPPSLVLDRDAIGLLRDGLGRYDMEIRWMAQLDDTNVLRLWRSWTGHQIYEAAVLVNETCTIGTIVTLMIERDPERYQGSMSAEPDRFEKVLTHSINTLRRFRAGHTPYGPSEGASPLPPVWPDSADAV